MGTLTSAGGTTLTGPFTVASGAGSNATSAKSVTANRHFHTHPGGGIQMDSGTVSAATLHMGPTITFNVATSSDQSAPAFAEASSFDKWLAITVSGGSYAIPLVSATI